MSGDRWQRRAACKNKADPRWDLPRVVAWCAELCLSCPVRLECLSEALDRHADEDVGVWGGTSPGQRDKIRRRRSTISKEWEATEQRMYEEDEMVDSLERWIAQNVILESASDRSTELLVQRTLKRMRELDGSSGTTEGSQSGT